MDTITLHNLGYETLRVSQAESWGTQERRAYTGTYTRTPRQVSSEAYKEQRELILWRLSDHPEYDWVAEIVDFSGDQMRFLNLFSKRKPSTDMLQAFTKYRFDDANADLFQRFVKDGS